MLRRWRKSVSSRRRARLNPKQQPITPCSSPVRDVSGQDDSPDSTTIPENQQQQPERHDEPRRVDRPTDQLSVHGQVAHTTAELEGLSLDIDTFTKGESDVVEAVGDDEDRKNAGPELPVSYFDGSEEASQTSSEESWASFPSSGSNSTDSSSDADEDESSAPGPAADASLPSPSAAFKFHEEFYGGGGDAVDETSASLSPIEEEFTMEDDGEEGLPYPVDTGPWMSRAIPKWAFLRSSNSLPTLGLGPEDFYHGGSALRHEVSAEEIEEEEQRDGPSDEDGESSKSSLGIATVGSVYL